MNLTGIEPSLIHTLSVIIQRTAPSETLFDDDFNEPVSGIVYKEAQEFDCQVHWVSETEKRKMSEAGFSDSIEGWLTFRKSDFDDYTGGLLNTSDKIIEIDDEKLEKPLYIVGKKTKGSYARSTLVSFYFSNRKRAN